MRFSSDSIELIERVEDVTSQRLSELAMKRAAAEGRDIVTKEDVRECVREAFDDVAAEQLNGSEATACTNR